MTSHNAPTDTSDRETLAHRLWGGVLRRRWLIAVTTLACVGGAAIAERNSPRSTAPETTRSLAARLSVPTTRSTADTAKLEAAVAAAREKQAAAHAIAERAKAAIETD